ncbi:MAG: transglutaminase-like domain-containing protein [Promethearchaeota archaeon]
MMKKYLEATQFLDHDSEAIRLFMRDRGERLKAATMIELSRKLFYFVRDEIKYVIIKELPTRKMMVASQVLKDGRGYCVQKAVLLATLGRAFGIPSRLHFADIRNYKISHRLKELMGTNLFVWHGFTEFYLNGHWVKLTPAFDRDLSVENNYPLVEFNGVNDAVFPNTGLNGELFMVYERDNGYYHDLPYKRIIRALVDAYGSSMSMR